MKNKTILNQPIYKVIIVLGILILLNIISIRIFSRVDLTENNIYTLSDASKEMVADLDDIVTVKAYFTEELPAPYNNNRRMLKDMLDEYRAYAGKNIRYEFISPEEEEDKQQLRRKGIQPVDIQVVEEDKVEVKRAFMGVTIQYEDKQEVIPVIKDLSTLEYDISSAIKKLTEDDKKVVAYTTGHGEVKASEMSLALNQLREQYMVDSVDLSAGGPIPPRIKTLLIINPERPFSKDAKYKIDQYLMKGGRIALLNGRLKIDPTLSNPQGQFVDLDFNDMLAHYGIKVNKDAVIDAQCINIMVQRQQGQFNISNQVQFPYIPQISELNEEHVVVNRLNNVILQFPSSIDTSLASQRNIDVEVLATSSEKSGRKTGRVFVQPFYEWTNADFPEKYIPVAAVYGGNFTSFYKGKKPAPEATQSPETRILVVGTGYFMLDQITQRARENLTFFANIVDYLSDDSGLIQIRSKNVSVPPLEEVESGTKKMIKYGNMFVPPIIVIIFGLLRWRRRQSIKKSIEQQLS